MSGRIKGEPWVTHSVAHRRPCRTRAISSGLYNFSQLVFTWFAAIFSSKMSKIPFPNEGKSASWGMLSILISLAIRPHRNQFGDAIECRSLSRITLFSLKFLSALTFRGNLHLPDSKTIHIEERFPCGCKCNGALGPLRWFVLIIQQRSFLGRRWHLRSSQPTNKLLLKLLLAEKGKKLNLWYSDWLVLPELLDPQCCSFCMLSQRHWWQLE
jgi:hypothetical protein